MTVVSTGVDQVNASSQSASSDLNRRQEGKNVSADDNPTLPPAPPLTALADVVSVNPQVTSLPNGEVSVRAWRHDAQAKAHLDPHCSSALYLRALELFEKELGKIVSSLTESLALEIDGIAHQLENCGLNPSHANGSAPSWDAGVAGDLLSRKEELTSSLVRVSEWIKPGAIIDDLSVSSSRDTCERMRCLFLKNGNATIATIVLDNKDGRWVVGDIFFFLGTEISKEFGRLGLYTATPRADNVLSSRSPTR